MNQEILIQELEELRELEEFRGVNLRDSIQERIISYKERYGNDAWVSDYADDYNRRREWT